MAANEYNFNSNVRENIANAESDAEYGGYLTPNSNDFHQKTDDESEEDIETDDESLNDIETGLNLNANNSISDADCKQIEIDMSSNENLNDLPVYANGYGCCSKKWNNCQSNAQFVQDGGINDVPNYQVFRSMTLLRVAFLGAVTVMSDT